MAKVTKEDDAGHVHDWDGVGRPWEPREQLTCLSCGAHFKDMEHYIIAQTKNMHVASVIDCGCGLKGIVGQAWWNYRNIDRGWGCDIWVVGPTQRKWQPLKMDALDLWMLFEPKSVDVVQAFGFLEHLTKEDGLAFLEMAETIASKLVIVSAATEVHGVDELGNPDPLYKVKRDGNPYHAYKSEWLWAEFEYMGYQSNWDDHLAGTSFENEAVAWKRLDEV
ncbi:MAG: class I SAM-dependent methyltransferase [Dehalococcoidales bacterium]|nr:class I SAM-dependent methyltransferase [Dehalococcoidales bacterium]